MAGATATPGLPSGSPSRFRIRQKLPTRARIKGCFQSPRDVGVCFRKQKGTTPATKRPRADPLTQGAGSPSAGLALAPSGGAEAEPGAARGRAGTRREGRGTGAAPLPAPGRPPQSRGSPRGPRRRPPGPRPASHHGEGGSLGAWLSATGWVASSGRFPPVSRPQVFFSKKRGLDLILQGSSLERSLQGPAFGVCGRASAPDFRHSPGPLRGRFSLRPPWAELRQCGAASQ